MSVEEKQSNELEATSQWDVIVYCGEMHIKCSSYILKTRSEYFQQVISMLPSLEEGIYLEEVSVYMYVVLLVLTHLSDSILMDK
jgi:hypothetical protein